MEYSSFSTAVPIQPRNLSPSDTPSAIEAYREQLARPRPPEDPELPAALRPPNRRQRNHRVVVPQRPRRPESLRRRPHRNPSAGREGPRRIVKVESLKDGIVSPVNFPLPKAWKKGLWGTWKWSDGDHKRDVIADVWQGILLSESSGRGDDDELTVAGIFHFWDTQDTPARLRQIYLIAGSDNDKRKIATLLRVRSRRATPAFGQWYFFKPSRVGALDATNIIARAQLEDRDRRIIAGNIKRIGFYKKKSVGLIVRCDFGKRGLLSNFRYYISRVKNFFQG